jgi:ubiquitin-protein ligase
MEINNLLKWRAFLAGPEDSPYKDSYFELHINLD